MSTVKTARMKAVMSMNVEFFKEHMREFGYYYRDVYMSDRFIDMMIHKEVYHMRKAQKAKKQEAKEWLLEHGYSLDY